MQALRKLFKILWPVLVCCILPPWAIDTRADTVKIAVAANFTPVMKELAKGFERSHGHTALISFGSTGKLYAQILKGAPFAIFLAADQDRPQQLEQAGKASRRFTYAIGGLVLWSKHPNLVDSNDKILHNGSFQRLAIANPKTAPYGHAAMEVLKNLDLDQSLRGKLVRGDSIAQTYQFVATGGAQLGFVAQAQVMLNPTGSRWQVPPQLYTPIRQDAVLLEEGREDRAALALMAYLQSAEARSTIERFGYGLE